VSGLIPVPRDVLTMLEVELARARRGEQRPWPEAVDVDLVEMLVETIDEIKRLRRAIATLEWLNRTAG